MAEDFRALVQQIVAERGLEMPKALTNDVHREVYLEYLHSKNLSEEEVLPIFPRDKVSPEMHAQAFMALIEAFKSDNKREQAMVLDLMQTLLSPPNTNHLISRMSYTLLEEFRSARVSIPDFFAGVYPTGCINAHCVVRKGIPLVLIDSGAFEMVETAVAAFLSKRNETEQAELVIEALDNYFVRSVPPDPRRADHPTIDWGSWLPSTLCTAIEEFMISHELGHIKLGHIGENARAALPQVCGPALEVQHKDNFQEYQADCWAFMHLVKRARQKADDDTALLLACTGALIFMNIGLMIEAMAEKTQVPIRDSHPPAENRLYMLDIAAEVMNLQESTGVARKFHKIVRELCVLLGVEERVPPMLSRELNRIAVRVFTDVGIEFQHARFLTEFV